MRRLDEHRQAERARARASTVRCSRERRKRPRARPRSRPAAIAARGHQLLEEHLVHAQRRGRDARADVGHVERLEQPLHGAVLAEGAVQRGERDVGAEQAAARAHAQRLAVAAPARRRGRSRPTRPRARRRAGPRARRRRGQRDLVLGGAPAGEHRDRRARSARALAPSPAQPAPAGRRGRRRGGRRRRCGRGGRRRCRARRPRSSRSRPCARASPAAGLCLSTRPTCAGSVVRRVHRFGLRPACRAPPRLRLGLADDARDRDFLGRLRDREVDLRAARERCCPRRRLREHGPRRLPGGHLLGDRADARGSPLASAASAAASVSPTRRGRAPARGRWRRSP